MDWFLGNRHLGTSPDTPGFSIAYFCPKCGDIWARVAIPGRPFFARTHGCQHCGPAWYGDEAGCLTERTPSRGLEHLVVSPNLPREVLIHDFKQLEKLHDRTNSTNPPGP